MESKIFKKVLGTCAEFTIPFGAGAEEDWMTQENRISPVIK
jgi:hypothetical protein